MNENVTKLLKEQIWYLGTYSDEPNAVPVVQFTASSGRHSVLERPFSEANGRPFVS